MKHHQRTVGVLLCRIVASVLFILPAKTLLAPALPLTFTVDSTADDPDDNPGDGVCHTVQNACTLRAAIEEANAHIVPGADTIQFAISGNGVHTISPASPLPVITDPVIIDGTTQPGFSGTPLIEVEGSQAGADAVGLMIGSGPSTVKGLAINRFNGKGLQANFSADGNTIQGNRIGTNAAGTGALANKDDGVFIGSSNNAILQNLISGNIGMGLVLAGGDGNTVKGNLIGVADGAVAAVLSNAFDGIFVDGSSHNVVGGTGQGEPNVISGNGAGGVLISGSSSIGNQFLGNRIGTDFAGDDLGNLGAGVLIGGAASHNTIGGTEALQGNVIAFNTGKGIVVSDGVDNGLLGNSIFANGDLGMDLGNDGVTLNDVGDGDSGANNLQNFPVLASIVSFMDGTALQGTFNSFPNGLFRLEFFSNDACDDSGHGEGQTYLGFKNVATDGSGNASFTASFDFGIAAGKAVTATATDMTTDSSNSTSEFSACATVGTNSIQFGAESYSVDENAGSASITVTRTGDATGPVSVAFATSDGTAVSGQDYTATAQTVDFADGETSKTVAVPILDDALLEGDETVHLTLSNPTASAVLGVPVTATLTIVDDETSGGGTTGGTVGGTTGDATGGTTGAATGETTGGGGGGSSSGSVSTASGGCSLIPDSAAVGVWANTGGPVGGEVSQVVVDGGVIYAGANEGGLFQFEDVQNAWTPFGDFTNGLTGLSIQGFVVDGGVFYAGTDKGVFRYDTDPQTWSAVNDGIDPNEFTIESLLVDSGILYAGTSSKIYRYDAGQNQWTEIGGFGNGLTKGNKFDSLVVGSGILYAANFSAIFQYDANQNQWTKIGDSTNGLDHSLFHIAYGNGVLYAGSRGGGVFQYDPNQNQWTNIGSGGDGLSNTQVWRLAFDAGTLYAATGGGLFQYDGDHWTNVGDNEGLYGLDPLVVFVTFDAGNIYAGTDNGVFRFDGNQWSNVGGNKGLIATTVYSMATDGESLFACDDEQGVFKYDVASKQWSLIGDPDNGLSDNFVSALLMGGGALYAGACGTVGGVFQYDGSSHWTALSNTGMTDTCIISGNALGFDSGTLYAGTGSGVFRYDGASSWALVGDNNGLTDTGINAIAFDSGVLYAGTDNGTVFKYDGGQGQWIKIGDTGNGLQDHNAAPAGIIFSLAFDSGVLDAGTNNGVYQYDGKSQWTVIGDYTNGFASDADQMFDLRGEALVFNSGVLYAATDNGVFKYDASSNRWSDIGQNNGLGNPGLFSLVFDSGTIFTGTAGDGVFDFESPVRLSASRIDFGDQNVNATSDAKVMTITIAGSLPVTVSGITITGDFTETDNCVAQLAGGATCNISVATTPSALGPATGAMTISDDALDSPQSVSLTVNGVVSGGGTTSPVCGNGILESGEECDDGNLVNGDGCTSKCTKGNGGSGGCTLIPA